MGRVRTGAVGRWVRRARRLEPGRLRAVQRRMPRGVALREDAALRAVAAVEALEPVLPELRDPREVVVAERVVARPDLPEQLRTMLPMPWRREWAPDDPRFRRAVTSAGADLVVLAKFDLTDAVKLRAAYAEAGLVVGVLPIAPFGACGVTRTARAHAVVGRVAPDLIPALVSFGEVGPSGRYVIERWVEGRPLMTPQRLAAATPEIVAGLGRVHSGYGVGRLRLSRWAPTLAERWAGLAGTYAIDARVHRAVTALLARDGALTTSWTHGDPVSSNVIETPDGIVLVDWENSGRVPVMTDGAKLLLYAADPEATLDTVLSGLGDARVGSVRADYSPTEELALALARLLAAQSRRADVLDGHPRAAAHDRRGRRLVQRLDEVLAA